jgi:hypothetical protein
VFGLPENTRSEVRGVMRTDLPAPAAVDVEKTRISPRVFFTTKRVPSGENSAADGLLGTRAERRRARSLTLHSTTSRPTEITSSPWGENAR